MTANYRSMPQLKACECNEVYRPVVQPASILFTERVAAVCTVFICSPAINVLVWRPRLSLMRFTTFSPGARFESEEIMPLFYIGANLISGLQTRFFNDAARSLTKIRQSCRPSC